MVLVIWAGFFKPGWCRKHPEIWSGDRFLNILGVDNLRNNFFACKSNDCFKKIIQNGFDNLVTKTKTLTWEIKVTGTLFATRLCYGNLAGSLSTGQTRCVFCFFLLFPFV